LGPMAGMSDSARDPRPLIDEVQAIIEDAAQEPRDLTAQEYARCTALLEAAEALAHLARLPITEQAA
jgi:hypothetical protein